jgi:hypothetical protein
MKPAYHSILVHLTAGPLIVTFLAATFRLWLQPRAGIGLTIGRACDPIAFYSSLFGTAVVIMTFITGLLLRPMEAFLNSPISKNQIVLSESSESGAEGKEDAFRSGFGSSFIEYAFEDVHDGRRGHVGRQPYSLKISYENARAASLRPSFFSELLQDGRAARVNGPPFDVARQHPVSREKLLNPPGCGFGAGGSEPASREHSAAVLLRFDTGDGLGAPEICWFRNR